MSQKRPPIEITITNDNDFVGWVTSALRIDEIYMTDVKSMVSNARKKLQPAQKISRLNILDHGNSQGIKIGDDWVTLDNINNYYWDLIKLKPYFTNSSFIHLQHCDIGQNKAFLKKLSYIMGIKIVAGTGKQHPGIRVNRGSYVSCDPKGVCIDDVGRP